MNDNLVYNNPEFDEFAADYDSALNRGLSVSGEQKEYFSRGRIAWLKRCLDLMNCVPESILDFGCGTGSAVPVFLDIMKVRSIIAIDPSPKSISIAERNYGSERIAFMTTAEFEPCGNVDIAYCNGVFHHIMPPWRATFVEVIKRALHPGGLFAFWENNPWNPGTRYVMSRIPFDRDAVPVTSLEACRLLSTAGFEILRIDFLFVFPRILKMLRLIEPTLSKLPLGAQYQILCRKP